MTFVQACLGFTNAEFNTWVMKPSELHEILAQRAA